MGARIVVASPFARGTDKLLGTQLLLTQAGRNELKTSFVDGFKKGAAAICTAIDTSHTHCNDARLFEDASRDNDLTYYVVGQAPTLGVGYTENGYKHVIPRDGVSVGEKRNFCGLLSQLSVRAARDARDEALLVSPAESEAAPLVGASITFSRLEDPHLGNRMEHQIISAAKEAPDFFAISGCATESDVRLVSQILRTHAKTFEVRSHINLKGMPELDDAPSTAGFDIPALLLLNTPPCNEPFREILLAVADCERIGGVSAPTPLTDAEVEEFEAMLAQTHRSTPMVLAGASESVGEIAVQSVSV